MLSPYPQIAPGGVDQPDEKLGGAIATRERQPFALCCQFCGTTDELKVRSYMSNEGFIIWFLLGLSCGLALLCGCCCICCLPDFNDYEFTCQGCNRITAINQCRKRL